jgi:hypothetical protein
MVSLREVRTGPSAPKKNNKLRKIHANVSIFRGGGDNVKEVRNTSGDDPKPGPPPHPSYALIGVVRPLELDGVFSYRLCFPCADVTDFAVRVIVPALTWDGVSNRFA